MECDDCDEMYSDDEATISDDCSETFEPVVCDKSVRAGSETDSSWGCSTEYFDKLNKTFGKSANVIGDIGPSEKDFFESTFDDRLLFGIITETNRYTEQNNSKNWVDVIADEMEAFIGCLIVMGIHQLPSFGTFLAR